MKILVQATALILLAGCHTSKSLADSSATPLAGTTWHYTDDDEVYDITFRSGGKTRSTNGADVTPDNDTWSQDGKAVSFEFNDGYSQYRGTFQTGNTITGTATNKADDRWTWTLKRAR